jgi:hypothetical protein
MRELVFLLEEESAKAMLQSLLPRILPQELEVRYLTFEGKQDLEKQLVRKIRAYRNSKARFVVLRDQDTHPDCRAVKTKLLALCHEAGRPDVLVRIACRELESFYLADLSAVEKGLGLKGIARYQLKQKFRQPDDIISPSRELQVLTEGRYQKVSGSREIGAYLDVEGTRSVSFHHLVKGIRRIAVYD